jgi:hypothetical protein
MKGLDLKSIILIEATILISIGLFSIDFLPRNHSEFLKICTSEWSNDATQYQICMQPYSREINLDKYTIGILALAFIATPIYIYKKKIFVPQNNRN